ncbi:MAG TPA: UDP-glucose--hexose-1-phosphate uridylyltransferase [Candidatus Acidoferrales bacterium]|nr:UDP-glucose--hexose-1-phosphate uridylyltransferase [Candidatus Acidoferrales bacterium]
MSDWQGSPHKRYNPLLDEWVLVSPHRTERPWLGERSAPATAAVPRYDPTCYLCPGNERAGGARNPQYTGTYVFDNDFAALLADTPPARYAPDDLLLAQSERGTCRVLCFSERHDLHLSSMPPEGIAAVVDAWAAQYAELSARPGIAAVTIFENRGAMMGASNPHPHGQLWADESLPNDLAIETRTQAAYRDAHGGCLLCAYVERERRSGERVVYANEHFTALVPFWAVWPFEVMLIGNAHRRALDELTVEERAALAGAVGDLTRRYDRLFDVPFPYSMGFHQRPSDGAPHDAWHVHAHYFPPLLRSATVRKYMVGYELLAQPQRDLTAEQAAARLRDA